MESEHLPPWQPEWAVPPGEILAEVLDERAMSQAELARRMARPVKTVSEIATGKAAITPETAVQLERVLGVSASLWNALEARYREMLARRRAADQLHQHVRWTLNFPLADMARFGLVSRKDAATQTVSELLALFEVSSPSGWDQQWGRVTAALRRSQAHETSRYALAAWLRWGELEAAKLHVAPYQEAAFLNALDQIRGLSRLASFELAVERVRELLSGAGVAFVVVPELPGARASGAARWLRSGIPIIQLSLRYLSDDQFWFSLFHEGGHIYRGRRRQDHVDDLDAKHRPSESEEGFANSFARDRLIDPSRLGVFLDRSDLSAEAVRSFAADLGIAPGIVVGRLQRDGAILPSKLNNLKRRYHVVTAS